MYIDDVNPIQAAKFVIGSDDQSRNRSTSIPVPQTAKPLIPSPLRGCLLRCNTGGQPRPRSHIRKRPDTAIDTVLQTQAADPADAADTHLMDLLKMETMHLAQIEDQIEQLAGGTRPPPTSFGRDV